MQAHGYVYELLRELGLTDFGATTVEFFVVRPMRILIIVVVALVVARFGARAVRKAIRGVASRAPLTSTSARAQQRASTLGDVLASLVKAAVWTVAGFVILGEVGVNLAPLIAGAGIAGIAIGFGAQSLVKDVISGLFILLEDQFGVGDLVTLEGTTGTVEDVTLRVTRVRAVDGTVWFVPNGELRKVGNSSMEWSRAIVDIIVPFDADLALAERIVREEADAMAADPKYEGAILDAPEDCGVLASDATTVTLREIVKTAPRQQHTVARDLRGRITARFKQEGVRKPA